MKPIPSPQDQGWDEDIIKILKRLGSLKVEYPAGLFAARRAAFVFQVEQERSGAGNDSFLNEPFLQQLESLKSVNVEYPQALRAARRAAFIDQIERYNQKVSTEAAYSEDREIARLFNRLKTVEAEYPSNLMAARRAAFKRQIALGGRVSVLEALRNSLHNLSLQNLKKLSMPTMSMMRTSLVVAALMLATLVGTLIRGPVRSFNPASPSSQGGFAQTGHGVVGTNTAEVAKIICKPGYLPPLCLAREFDKSQDLTFPGNGSARPAVAKDTLPGYGGVHKASYVNDGLYGPGASWISNSANSWIKIDLGKTTTINTIAFGRDRLGRFNDGDPGQFVIAVALSDDVYADGNSNNDYVEYTRIYDSKQTGFKGVVSGSETVKAHFEPVTARFIKITFANSGTAVDEVEAYMMLSPELANNPTKEHRGNPSGGGLGPISTGTSMPTDVVTTPIPSKTPVPPNTATPVPTNTPAPTDTPIPAPTNPPPTNTPIPPTSIPPTDPPPTSIPPTDPPPTSIPPTDPPPVDTSTTVPPSNLIEPLAVPTETSNPVLP